MRPSTDEQLHHPCRERPGPTDRQSPSTPRYRVLKSSILLAVFGLIASACAGTTIGAGPNGALLGDDELIVGGTSEETDDALLFDDTESDAAEDSTAPVQRSTVTMARANWSSGAMQAEIYAQLLEELGHEVVREGEVPPDQFYPALAAGDYDLWANSWPIVHDTFLDQTTASGDLIGDRVAYVGEQMLGGGLQGFLVDTATADRLEITSLDDIVNNPEIRAEFDTDGDGRADIAGCDVGWGCADVIDEIIASNEWEDVLNQAQGVHAELFAEQVERAEAGEPVLVYVWTPGPFITQLTPGENAVWLGVENPPTGQALAANLPEDQCRLSPCTLGFSPSDIVASANVDFLDAEPAAARLLDLIKISVLDVSFQNVKMLSGEDSATDIARHASEWIESNRSDVDRWLTQARGAS